MSKAGYSMITGLYGEHGNARPVIVVDLDNPAHVEALDRWGGCTVATIEVLEGDAWQHAHVSMHRNAHGKPVVTLSVVDENRDSDRSLTMRKHPPMRGDDDGARRHPTVYAQRINAGNDRNGNPRRGWFVYRATGGLIGFIDEGYAGRGNLNVWFPRAIELGSIEATPREYRRAVRDHRLMGPPSDHGPADTGSL